MPIVSVIVPIYNAEKYLLDCIESILSQNYFDIEILLVDDGSTDSSGIICDHFGQLDTRIRVFHQNNEGVTSARKKGVLNSLGRWIVFVDADDTIPQNALSLLLEATQQFDTDFVVGFMNDKNFSPSTQLTLQEWRRICISGSPILPGPVARLISRELFNDSIFDLPRNIVKGEDMIMNIRLSFRMTKPPVVIYRCVYYYRQHQDSCVHTFKSNAEYEHVFHHYCLDSIPNTFGDIFLPELVFHRLLKFDELYSNDPLGSEWYDTPFYHELLNDINQSNTKLHYLTKLKLRYKGPRNRIVVWKIVQAEQLVYRFICRLKTSIKKAFFRQYE